MIQPSHNLQLIFEHAVQTAKELKHEYITIEHLVYSIMCDQESYQMVKQFGADSASNTISKTISMTLKQMLKILNQEKLIQ